MRGAKPLNDKSEFLNLSPSFLAVLAGLIDGDGYISITRTTTGFIQVLLSISLDIRDELMLKQTRDTLGFGKLLGPYYGADGAVTVKLGLRPRRFNRTELQELLFPLLFHHGIFFLTDTRRAQYQLALYIFTS